MKKQDILIILIPTLLFVIAWIGFNIYHSWITPTIPTEEIEKVTSISPVIDTKTISELKNREFIESSSMNSNSYPLPTVTVTKAASESAKSTGGTTR